MNRKSMILILPLIALALMSCSLTSIPFERKLIRGTGPLTTETRQISGVERVSLMDVGNLTIIQGDEESLTVEANENLLPYLETEMRGRELVLKIRDGYRVDSDVTINYTLTVADLQRISVAGAANVTSDSLEVEELTLNVSGAGNVTIDDLQAVTLRAETNGAGNFTLKGSVDSQDLTINGVGNYSAGDLQTKETRVTINGAGECTVWVDESLDVRIGGFGNLNYYGSPSVSQSISGAGGVNSLGDHR